MISEIERFIAVVEDGSFTKASKKLFITQPALSLSILRLEKEINTKLFKRIGKKVVLTQSGELCYQITLQIIKNWKKIKNPLLRKQTGASYCSVGLYDNAALKLSKYFQKKLSGNNFRFEITIDRSASLIRGIEIGSYDLCISIFNRNLKLGENVKIIKIFWEKLLPVSSKKWKEKTNNIPFILYNKQSSTRLFIDEVFFENKIKPNIIVESTNPDFMKELAIGGCGVALLPKNFVERELLQKKLFIQKFPFSFQRQIAVFLSKEGNLKESDKIVLEIIDNLD